MRRVAPRPKRAPVSPARLRSGIALEILPIVVALAGAVLWLAPITGDGGYGVRWFVVLVFPLGMFSTGAGWVAVRHPGRGVGIVLLRGVVVLIMLDVGLATVFSSTSEIIAWFFALLAVCLISSALSAALLARDESLARRAPGTATPAGEVTPEPDVRTDPHAWSASEAIIISSLRQRWWGAAILASLVAASVAFVLLLMLWPRGSDAPRDTDISVKAARDFGLFPLYWVGTAYGGYPLDRIIGQYPSNDRDPVVFVYGTCGRSFETGCAPPLVVKSSAGCLAETSAGLLVRGRTAHDGAHLQVQAGDVVVTLYGATPQIEQEAAQDMFTANPYRANVPPVTPRGALPGSLCEVERTHPPAVPAAATPASLSTQESLPATVFAAFGNLIDVKSADDAARILGWEVLRSDDPRFTLASVGAIRELPGDPPRLEQTKYLDIGHKYPIDLSQEPESIRAFDVAPYASTETIGQWTGLLWTYSAQLGFEFFSGEVADGQRIRVSVFGERGAVTLDDIRAFVRTLKFG